MPNHDGYCYQNSPQHHAWEAGDVVRLGDWPFADAVVLGFREDGRALLARVDIYASGVGTSSPRPLIGYELMGMINLPHGNYPKVASGRIT